ncbi:MAG: hypothetical protein NTX79_01105 [Candidatus Micrarchaeota archaeon]|nr:hypothetical protein [Candidatus Micrarchaeota archaeon]
MEKINTDFKNTCRILFGQDIGELPEFAPYLSETMFPYRVARSSLSGKEVMLSGPYYPDDARFVSQDEVALQKMKPLSINDIKDIDSLFAAASERAAYCGNKVFGTCLDVAEVDNCADCMNVLHSHDIYSTKNAAYCSNGRLSDSLYGVSGFCRSHQCMRCAWCAGPGLGASRCFESYGSVGTTGAYYAFNCCGCSDVMFCFNLRGKSHMIGNLQLPKDRYGELRAKLASEMAQMLGKDKRLFSLVDLAAGAGGLEKFKELERDDAPMAIRKALDSCCRVVLGKEAGTPEKLSQWLLKRAVKVRKVIGRKGTPTYHSDYPMLCKIPASHVVTLDEALEEAVRRKIAIRDGETPGLDEVAARAGEIALFTFEKREGRCLDITEGPGASDSTNCHRLLYAFSNTLSGFSSVVTESKYVFGGYLRILNSEFCLSCYNLTQCSKCLETDSSYRSRGLYFCHNCENVEDGILCFNLKGARYAVLNQPVSKEEYARVKKMLLDYVNKELEEKGGLERGIFSLAPARPLAKKGK